MSTTIRFEFENTQTGGRFGLDYELIESDFVRRWAMVAQKAMDRGRKIQNDGNFFGAAFDSEPELRAKMEESLRIVNAHKRRWIDLAPYPNMSREFVMKLHEEFERLEPHPDFQVETSPHEVRLALNNLNINIHKYEGIDGAKLKHIDIFPHPVDRFQFQEEDYELFHNHRTFGELFLAYGVTGVPVLNAFQTDHRLEPVPQYNFTAGVTLWLTKDDDFDQYPQLEAWLRRKWGWYLGHPKLAIGYITLGNLKTQITSDEIAARLGMRPRALGYSLSPRPDMRAFRQIEPAPSNVEAGNPPTDAFRSPPPVKSGMLPQFVIELENPKDGSREVLAFDLVDQPTTWKWLLVMRKGIAENRPVIDNGHFYGFGLEDRDSLLEAVRTAAAELKAFGVRGIPAIREVEGLIDRNDGVKESEQAMRSAYTLLRTLQKLESWDESRNGHINVDLHGGKVIPLEDEDFRLFTPDSIWGGLYLSYGQLGTPTLAAFRSRSREPFEPQRSITPGVTVDFYPDERLPLTADYPAWLRENGMNPNDRHLAFGRIRLGRLSTRLSREETRELVRLHPRVRSVSFRPRPAERKLGVKAPVPGLLPAEWPGSKELLRHLELVPWLMLPFEFDHEGCYREAAALLDRFVIHRSYDQSSTHAGGGKWKSLGIRALDGDSTKTQNHTDYGALDPTYKLSEIAELCPKTLAFLSRLTDLDTCQRVRFMLLEPGASIATHSDAPTSDVAYAVNIALNMPDGCDFWVDVNPDGTRNPYSHRIPIQPGSAFIFNNARFHNLVNNSTQPRIHLIIHGPIRFTNGELLQAARAQNRLPDEKSLMNALICRYSRLGRRVETSSELFADWITAGIDSRVIPDSIRLAVIREPGVSEDLQEEAVHRITLASVFPTRPPVIRSDEVDGWLRECLASGASHAVLITAGTYAFALPTFLMEILRSIHVLDDRDAAVMGHIMNRPNRREDLPFLHEQFLILDLNRWNTLGQTSLGAPYEGKEADFPGYRASAENIHDDYTPLWLKPDPGVPSRRGRTGFGTALLARSLEAGLSVENVPIALRDTKKFTYPRTGRCPQYQAIKREIAGFLESENRKVYVFNNECPTVLKIPGFRPDILVSVAAGFKPFSILRQYWPDRRPGKIVLVDISRQALEHFKWLTVLRKYESVVSFLAAELGKRQALDGDAREFVKRHLDDVLRTSFGGDFKELIGYFEMVAHAAFVNADFISDPEHVLSALEPGKSAVFWHSNAWSSNMSMYRGSRAELDDNYRKLGRAICAKHGLSAWSRIGNQEMLIGKSLEQPRILITSGGDPNGIEPGSYRRMDEAHPSPRPSPELAP